MLLTDEEIMDINQNAEFDSAIGYARKIESAVLAKLNPRVAELEAVLRECREAMQRAKYSGTPYTSSYNRAIAKIDEVLK